MSEKRLLHAAGLLVRSLKMIKKPEMTDIGAVSDLRTYLIGQENVSFLVSNSEGVLCLNHFSVIERHTHRRTA